MHVTPIKTKTQQHVCIVQYTTIYYPSDCENIGFLKYICIIKKHLQQ